MKEYTVSITDYYDGILLTIVFKEKVNTDSQGKHLVKSIRNVKVYQDKITYLDTRTGDITTLTDKDEYRIELNTKQIKLSDIRYLNNDRKTELTLNTDFKLRENNFVKVDWSIDKLFWFLEKTIDKKVEFFEFSSLSYTIE